MKVGDLVKHKHGVMQGSGIILNITRNDAAGFPREAELMWTSHGLTKIHKRCAMQYMEVVNESR